MKNKIVIIGSSGQLGSSLIKEMPGSVGLTHKDIEIEKPSTYNILKELSPNIIINTAAYHKVDECETNIEKAFEINTLALKHLCELANKIKATLIHISTDYVFDGKKQEYDEKDVPNPLNIYGLSKYAGEKIVSKMCKKYYIFRVSSLFGERGAQDIRGNFVTFVYNNLMQEKRINIISDNLMRVTYTVDAARAINQAINKEIPYGIYHIVNEGPPISWYTFAKKIANICCPEKIGLIHPIGISEDKRIAERPKYSALLNNKIKNYGINIRDWRDALKEYLKAFSW